jgi:hypothetical protein
MLEFRVTNVVPPGGQYFYDVEGYPVQAATRTGLRTKINQAYAALGSEVPADIWEQVMDHMCRHLPEGFCTGDDDGKPRAKVLTLQQVRKNTEDVVQQSEMAPPSQSRFQAEKCLRCDKNNKRICTSCSGVSAWASRRVGRPDMPASYSYLGICEVTGAALVAQVNLMNLPENEEYPDDGTCWAREDS